MWFLATFFRDGHVEVGEKEADFAGFGGRGWGGVGRLAGVENDEVEVGFEGGGGCVEM